MLDEAKKRQLALARIELDKSDLAPDTKDNLSQYIESSANAANGSVDKLNEMANAQFQSALFHVKNACRTPRLIKEIVDEHAAACPGKTTTTRTTTTTTPGPQTFGKFAIPIDILKAALKSWQLASVLVAMFVAPNAPDIIKTFIDVFK